MAKAPGRGSDQFNLRFPDGMREQVAKSAEANGRSMNAEIIARLEESFRAFYDPVDMVELMKALDANNADLIEVRITPNGVREILMLEKRQDDKK